MGKGKGKGKSEVKCRLTREAKAHGKDSTKGRGIIITKERACTKEKVKVIQKGKDITRVKDTTRATGTTMEKEKESPHPAKARLHRAARRAEHRQRARRASSPS